MKDNLKIKSKGIKNSRGVTLVALVVTIVVLIILAAISINIVLQENQINKAKEAALQTKKAQYFEEIKLEIADEQIERQGSPKAEAFIVSLSYRLEGREVASKASKDAKYAKKAWVSSTIMCDEDGNTNEDPFDNNILIVTTKEGYDIYIDVDNSAQSAIIREDVFVKAETVTITYNANTGTGTMDKQSVKVGESIQLSANTYTKSDYNFVGWNTKSDGTGISYENNATIEPRTNIILYAQWEEIPYTITYDVNGGTGTVQTQSGTKVTLLQNNYTRANCIFKGWGISSTSSDDSQIYQPGTEMKINNNMTLYAIWELATISVGTKIKYKNYEFVIYGESDGKYLARPVTNCGTYMDYTPSSSMESYLTNTFGISGKIEANVFSFSEKDIVRQCGIKSGSIWMIYSSGIRPVTYKFDGFSSSSAIQTAYLVPKLIIDPSVIGVESNQTYAVIKSN